MSAIIVGIDEVGRGCWAGPLVAGAVILRQPIDGLRDSKKLSKSRRETLAAQIHAEALAVGLGWVWPEVIDTGGITTAVKMAMADALAAIQVAYDEVIVDGHINYLEPSGDSSSASRDGVKISALVRADDTIPAVSAASIVAKVARDAYMAEASVHYPGYGFEQHVGYGTAAHMEALQRQGVCAIHRMSYKPVQAMLA